jgi:NAD(P)-dependent dehydrogenase (short-subunit alcohol dehydrogenase family)
MRSLEGKIVYLTGATKGIGRAVAIRLAKEKCRLAICGRDKNDLLTVSELIQSEGADAAFAKSFDLSNEHSLLEYYREARAHFGPPHILINNAGYNSRKAALWEVDTDEFDKMFAVNIRAPFILMRESFQDMRARGNGHVVNILSTVCHSDLETMGVYTAAKRGLQALTNVFRKEALPFNIRVTSIYPGGADTSFRKAERLEYMRPESVAEAVFAALTLPEDLVVHHMTFRPMVESNF